MVVTYYIKLFQTVADRHIGILMSLLLLVAETIIHRIKFRNLKNNFKNKVDEKKRKYTKQQNYCVSQLRKSNREYYISLDVKNITDNKTFWKTVKPFLSNKQWWMQPG